MKTRIEAFIEMLKNNEPSGFSVGAPIRFPSLDGGIKGGDIPEYYLKPDYSRIPTLNIKNVVQFLNSHHAPLKSRGGFVYYLVSTLFSKNYNIFLKANGIFTDYYNSNVLLFTAKILPMRRGEGICPVIYPSGMVRY